MRFILMACLVSVCVPIQALGVCKEATTLAQLASAARAGESAFANMDAESLLTQSMLARSQILPCLGQSLSTRDAASFHRLMALEAFISGDNARVTREFHAARKLDPGYSLPADVAGEGHPLLALYDASAQASDGDAEPVYPPQDGWAMVAGVRNAARYSLTPVVVQVFAASGALIETRYVQSGEALPMWGVNPFGLTAEDIGLTNLPRDPRPWFIVAASTFIVSGIFYAIAMDAKAKYKDPLTQDAQRDDLALRANSLGASSIASGSAGLICTGLGVGFQVKFGLPKSIKKEAAHVP